jgi:hypothetical protein
VAPIRHLSADAAAPLRSFLDKLRKAAAYIDSRRVRDDRKVMLWSLQRDLTAAGEALEILESQVAECAALYEHVRAEAARIAGRDGCAIAPDDPNSYRATGGAQETSAQWKSHAAQATRQPSRLDGSQEEVYGDFPGLELSCGDGHGGTPGEASERCRVAPRASAARLNGGVAEGATGPLGGWEGL